MAKADNSAMLPWPSLPPDKRKDKRHHEDGNNGHQQEQRNQKHRILGHGVNELRIVTRRLDHFYQFLPYGEEEQPAESGRHQVQEASRATAVHQPSDLSSMHTDHHRKKGTNASMNTMHAIVTTT